MAMQLERLLQLAKADDPLSLVLLMQSLERHLADYQLNEDELLKQLLEKAKISDKRSLELLCGELLRRGFGPKEQLSPPKKATVGVLDIKPEVKSKIGEKFALIWHLDRGCQSLEWLVGRQVRTADGLYLVQGVEAPEFAPPYDEGTRVTLMVKPIVLES